MKRWRAFGPWVVALLVGGALWGGPASADASELVSATNSTLAWTFDSNPNAVDGTPTQDNDCAVHIPHTDIFECATEFFYTRPDGTPGTRWFSVEGIIQWVGVHPNPYGAGEVGTPKSLSYGASSSWVRYWHSESSGCLRTWRIHGVIESNFPCPAYQIWHGTRTEGHAAGQPGFPWLYDYHCSRASTWTTCRNALGDAYRYRGAYPRIWNGGSGSAGAEVARTCSNHAGRVEGDGQYTDGAITYAVGINCSQALALVKPRYPGLFGPGSSLFGPGRNPYKLSFMIGGYECYLTPDGPVDLAVCTDRSRRFTFI
jgi:hypothetical protein